MASPYSEDIGYIKATIEAMHDDMKDMKESQGKIRKDVDCLIGDAAFRTRMRKWGRALLFVAIAVASLRIGDIKSLF